MLCEADRAADDWVNAKLSCVCATECYGEDSQLAFSCIGDAEGVVRGGIEFLPEEGSGRAARE